MPSNEAAWVRPAPRHAARHSVRRDRSSIARPFLHELTPSASSLTSAPTYPELAQRKAFVEEVVRGRGGAVPSRR
jgi:hypothetical protein